MIYCAKCGGVMSTMDSKCPGCGTPPYPRRPAASPAKSHRPNHGAVLMVQDERRMFIKPQAKGMQKVGGIVALFGGIFSTIVAIGMLLGGGIRSHFQCGKANP